MRRKNIGLARKMYCHSNNKRQTQDKMENKIENQKEFMKQLRDLFEGKTELSNMTGDIELCGKTADDVIRQIKEDERKGGKDDENRA